MAALHDLSFAERVDWLRLARTEGVGPRTFHRLIARFKTAERALAALPEIARKAGRKTAPAPVPRAAAEAELEAADAASGRMVAFCEPDYPAAIRTIPDPPPVLALCGAQAPFSQPCIAIVGARNASAAGRKFARMLAADFADAGVTVASGLARGIDGAAHAETLAHNGATVAVVAGGADVVYPPEHAGLHAEIAARGCVLSERPMGATPRAADFPRRNRLISGLSFGIVVVEAAARSGTLITARCALEQGREVFAAPGSPLDPRCQGTNRLIRDGATLIESAGDVLEALRDQTRAPSLLHGRSMDPDLFDAGGGAPGVMNEDIEPYDETAGAQLRRQVLDLLGYAAVHRDELARETGAPAGLLADVLLDLVLSGEAEEQSGGGYARAT